MEEERNGIAESETTEVKDVEVDVQEGVEEATLEPEDRARQLFASYLEPVAEKEEKRESPLEDGGDVVELLLADEEEESEDSDDAPLGEAKASPASEDDDEEMGEGGRSWFVIHSYSGYENKVKKNLEHRIESLGMQDKIFEVVVPTEEEIELKDGQRRTVERRIFPGYILVDMIMNEDSWYVVRNTPGVTGFVGSVRRPTPLRQRDVDRVLKRMSAETPRVKVTFLPGQKVRICDGPFEDFVGAVDEIYADKGKVRILVSFFGRETPVELDFLQVEKI
jgi:transcriptional antiterminator NusG